MVASCGNVAEYIKGVFGGDKERIDSLQNALAQMEKKLDETKQNSQIATSSSASQEIFTL